mmetsp:Transcript_14082/g.41287  ORF Transcript_14082/g.41287 Transcript_14082/m.41287 type:complete len:143 (-) Transcript_14082:10-438(-)
MGCCFAIRCKERYCGDNLHGELTKGSIAVSSRRQGVMRLLLAQHPISAALVMRDAKLISKQNVLAKLEESVGPLDMCFFSSLSWTCHHSKERDVAQKKVRVSPKAQFLLPLDCTFNSSSAQPIGSSVLTPLWACRSGTKIAS